MGNQKLGKEIGEPGNNGKLMAPEGLGLVERDCWVCIASLGQDPLHYLLKEARADRHAALEWPRRSLLPPAAPLAA